MSAESVLEIRIRPDGPGRYHVDAKTSAGDVKETTFASLDPKFSEYLIGIQRSFARSPQFARSIDPIPNIDIDRTTLRDIGIKLFDMLLNDQVKGLYQDLCDDAIRKGQSNRIRIRNDVPELSFVPWELMFDQKLGQYISCYNFIHLTRGVDAPDIFSKRTTPITILGMAARPKTIDGRVVGFIDSDTEQQRITEAFTDLEEQELVDLCWTGSCSLFSLGLRLDKPPAKGNGLQGSWDVFHFIGHGGIDQRGGTGYLVVQEDGGIEGRLLYAEDLSGLLVGPRGPQLVVLSSCSGAQAKPGELFGDTASTLIRAGIPSVVAMQSEITDKAAILFMTSFYNSLANKNTLQHAMTIARNQIKLSYPTEWPTPVLYLRGDGTIFQPG